jgi:hypothetical protein
MQAGGPVYESCFGTLTNSVGISTLDNPVYASRALNSRLLRMVQEAHSHIPVQKVDTRVTLAAEEERRGSRREGFPWHGARQAPPVTRVPNIQAAA